MKNVRSDVFELTDQNFSSEREWINKGRSWLQNHPRHGQFFKAILFDRKGMICLNGGDMAKATYPVYWIWPDQNLFDFISALNTTRDKEGA